MLYNIFRRQRTSTASSSNILRNSNNLNKSTTSLSSLLINTADRLSGFNSLGYDEDDDYSSLRIQKSYNISEQDYSLSKSYDISKNNINSIQSNLEKSNQSSVDKIFITVGKYLPNFMRLKMAFDCCAGVSFLHAKGLMHCDIKSLNFLVTKDFTVKLSDVGEARIKENLSSSEARELPR